MEKQVKYIWLVLTGCICLSILTFSKKTIDPDIKGEIHRAVLEYRPFKTAVLVRALNTAYRPSLGQPTIVVYSPTITASLTLTAGQTGTIDFQTSPDGVTYTSQSKVVNGSTGTLVVGLNTNNAQGSNLVAVVPPGYYFQLVSSGTETFAGTQTQESQF